ncbi:hypothetical protein NDU88_005771 [Pleurodeles waltl]|uniref:Uncharacterized protein n=1 Tax=Pleurodeles waltl TaxID=8319 RepID=A0AAV7SML2_PLEWA|nr:hypothetical protein NDU88_005771 [Pleurodeles waltl]
MPGSTVVAKDKKPLKCREKAPNAALTTELGNQALKCLTRCGTAAEAPLPNIDNFFCQRKGTSRQENTRLREYSGRKTHPGARQENKIAHYHMKYQDIWYLSRVSADQRASCYLLLPRLRTPESSQTVSRGRAGSRAQGGELSLALPACLCCARGGAGADAASGLRVLTAPGDLALVCLKHHME